MNLSTDVKSNQVVQKNDLHVHALWRTGSTKFWSLLREANGIKAFYEPFHENLLDRTHKKCQKSHDSKAKDKIFRHPKVADHYFAEFPLREKGGIEAFNQRFILEDFVMGKDSNDSEMKLYIQYLIDHAKKTKDVSGLQYNRSSLRIEWLKENFGGTHVYLARNPAGIFESSTSFTKKDSEPHGPGNYFIACPIMVIGKNSESEFFRDTAEKLKIPNFKAETFLEEIAYYQEFAKNLSIEDQKDIIALFWTLGLCQATLNSDIIIDVDRLFEETYSDKKSEELSSQSGHTLDLNTYRPMPNSENHLDISNRMKDHLKEQVKGLGLSCSDLVNTISGDPTKISFIEKIFS